MTTSGPPPSAGRSHKALLKPDPVKPPRRSGVRSGSLVVAGSGIAVGQVSVTARGAIESADVVFELVTNNYVRRKIAELNPRTLPLQDLYAVDRPRAVTYSMMTDRILGPVRDGHNVCTVFYGSPTHFDQPGHTAVRVARREGYMARMLPGVSAEVCLYADLGLDPAAGVQMFEATSFLVRGVEPNQTVPLILWQTSTVGNPTGIGATAAALTLLSERLSGWYGSTHECVHYRAPQFDFCDAEVAYVSAGELATFRRFDGLLLVPPRRAAALDKVAVERLGMDLDQLRAFDEEADSWLT